MKRSFLATCALTLGLTAGPAFAWNCPVQIKSAEDAIKKAEAMKLTPEGIKAGLPAPGPELAGLASCTRLASPQQLVFVTRARALIPYLADAVPGCTQKAQKCARSGSGARLRRAIRPSGGRAFVAYDKKS